MTLQVAGFYTSDLQAVEPSVVMVANRAMSQRVRRQYSDSDVVAALIAVKNGLSLRKAAAQFGVPQATLCDKKKQKHCIGRGRPGPASKLGHEQEQRLVVYLQHMALIGHEIARKDVAAIVKSILDAGDGQGGATRNSRFANCNMPSIGWVCRFFNRFRELDACMPVNHSRLRTPASESTIREWFDRLTFFLRVHYDINVMDFLSDSNAAQIFSVRENTFPLAVSSEWRSNQSNGKRSADHSSINDEKQVTVLCCGGADGRLPKPFVVFPGKECSSDHSCSNPLDLDVVSTPGGLISPDFFCQWLTSSFFPSVKDKVSSPILLFVDCPSLLISIAVYDFCTQNGIILFCLPYHASCVMQPLEMSVFRPLQVIWNDALLAFDEKHCGAAMSKAQFIPFFRIAWQKAQIKSQNIKLGFRMTGLVPFNPDVVSYSDLAGERVPVPQKKFLVTLEEISSKTEKLGMVKIFQVFEDCMTDDLRFLFENRFAKGYDRVDDKSDRSILWQFYRQCRLLVGDGPHKFQDNQVTYKQVDSELKNTDFTMKEEQGFFQCAEIDGKQEQIDLDEMDEIVGESTSLLVEDSSLSSAAEATTVGKKCSIEQGLTIIRESVTQIDANASSSSLGATTSLVNHSHSNMLSHAANICSTITTQSTDHEKLSLPLEQSMSINSTIKASEHANKTLNLEKIIGRHHSRVQKKWKQKEFFAYMCKQAYKAQQLKKEFARLKSQEQCKVTEYLDLVTKKQNGAAEDASTSLDRRKEEELAREINLLKNITKHMIETDDSSTGTSGTDDE